MYERNSRVLVPAGKSHAKLAPPVYCNGSASSAAAAVCTNQPATSEVTLRVEQSITLEPEIGLLLLVYVPKVGCSVQHTTRCLIEGHAFEQLQRFQTMRNGIAAGAAFARNAQTSSHYHASHAVHQQRCSRRLKTSDC